MKGIINPLLDLPGYSSLIKNIEANHFPIGIAGVAGAQKAHSMFSLFKFSGKTGLVITHNELEAQKLSDDLRHFLPGKVINFPAKEMVFYDIDAMSKDIVSKRLNVLESLLNKEEIMVVTTADALMQKLPPADVFKQAMFLLQTGSEVKMDLLISKFVMGGYERVDTVDGRGQFAVRGGIIDFYSFSDQFAYRIEMFGDSIDSIRKFDAATQRSIEMVERLWIFPVTETVINPNDIEKIIERIERELQGTIESSRSDKERVKNLKKTVEEDIEKLKESGGLTNIDRYFGQFYESWATLPDFFPDNCIVFLDEPQKSHQKIDITYEEFSEMYKSLLEKGKILPNSFDVILDSNSIIGKLRASRVISVATLNLTDQYKYVSTFDFNGKDIGNFLNFEQLFQGIKEWKKDNYKIVLMAGNKATAQRINQEFRDMEIESTYYDSLDDIDIKPKQVIITHGALSGSFEYPSIRFIVISDKNLFGEDKKTKKAAKRKDIIEFTDLNTGDYVVHQAHGIGQYTGIEKLAVEGVTRDYLKIMYLNNDMLYIPTTQLELIQKYIGAEGKAPKLNKLGGTDWAKTKKRVRESLMNIAGELLAIYAQREASRGFAFSQDTIWQKQFEEQFPYQETEDQLRCIEEVKHDMENGKPMDRLLCGDVGFGKTEVAIRAAFKSAMDGKQTAYLVPTTILAQQHYNTFKQRMRDFPIKVEMLSRFRTLAQQKKILKDLKSGAIDILIGTHRIIQKDIQFKDLSLLIIDEEQRFGVAHKEKLKALKSNVDVLTLTATPIPRTLHMAMVGIRDMSVIYDPPEDRHPVQTFVMEYNSEVIKDAIIREINRKGQVFYLSNRVKSIYKVAAEVQALVPQASIVVAHGQMDEKQLEDLMVGFIEGKWNVLVCTTIIESGLDIPNVNTIIMEDADKMGLSQLYQLRGRVGRSNRLAYAYVTYRKDKVLSEEAEKRLKAIRDFTEFGSGFKIAMRDLEIRGAGNLIGAEQHGHMEAVGYDTYCRLLSEAVKQLKGEEVREDINTQIEISVSAYISDDFIKNENHKIDMYKKIASDQDDKDIEEIEDELIDRYGDIPKEVYNLLEITRIKILAKSLGINSISDKTGAVIIQFNENTLKIEVLGKLIGQYKGQILFTASNPPYITYKPGIKEPNKLFNIKNLLQGLKKLQMEQ